MNDITLTLSQDDYKIIMKALLELKGRVCIPVVTKIQQQIIQNQNKKTENIAQVSKTI